MPDDAGLDDETNLAALFCYVQSLDRSVSNIGLALLGMTRDIEIDYHSVGEDITNLHI